jgi:methionine-rich copper-binding protein CopC
MTTGTRLVLSLLLLSAGPVSGWAHAFLDHAEPSVGSQVKSSPAQVKIWFTGTPGTAIDEQ